MQLWGQEPAREPVSRARTCVRASAEHAAECRKHRSRARSRSGQAAALISLTRFSATDCLGPLQQLQHRDSQIWEGKVLQRPC